MFISLNAVVPGISVSIISENFSNLFGELLKQSDVSGRLLNISFTIGVAIILRIDKFYTCEKQWTNMIFRYNLVMRAITPFLEPAIAPASPYP